MRKIIENPAPVYASFEGVKAYAAEHDKIYCPVRGDCMEGAGIDDGDIIAVDFTKMPVQGDAAMIYSRKMGCCGIKEYYGAWGPFQWVRTHNDSWSYFNPDGKVNFMLPADHIFGVVYACYGPDRKRKWKRDISDRPTELSRKQVAAGGGNIGEVVEISERGVVENVVSG